MKKLKYLLCGITMCALACSSSKDDGDGPGKGASNTLKVMSFNVRYNSATRAIRTGKCAKRPS